jgi:cell division protease FtsH
MTTRPQEPRPRPPRPPQSPQSPQPPRGLSFLWLIWLGLIVWNVMTFWPRPHPEARIPYTTFLAQVRANNVAKVGIADDEISGSFVKPFVWPQPASGVSASGAVPRQGAGVGKPDAKGAVPPPASPAPAPNSGKSGRPPRETPHPYSRFVTIFPQSVGDTSLMPLLEAHHVEVDVARQLSPWLTALLANGLPLLLLFLFFGWMGRRAAQSQAGIFGFGRTRARQVTGDQPKVTFDDVAGADEAKADLQEEVDFLRHPQKYHAIGARIPRGVLLVGPPGTGKTLLARAVAGEAGVPFFSISGSEFVEMFVGVGASRVRDLFEQAKAASPAIVFIDEMDAVGRRRGAGMGAVNDEREQTLNQLLVEMDGFDERHEVIILAATNRPDVLDPALLRPGRFDRRVEVPLPDRAGREGILRIHTRRLPLGDDVNLAALAAGTPGFSGADLATLANAPARVAARLNHPRITRADFAEAQDKVLLGGVRRLLLSEEDRRIIAYHEGGHAVVAWLTPGADPVQKVTIIPRGKALGVTEQVPETERYNASREYLIGRLAVMLGGRTAEELVIGDITTGAENDLVEATRLARRMVTRWGMGSLGGVAFSSDEQQPFLGYELAQGRDYSEATAARIDEDVETLLQERHAEVRRLLTGARESLDRLAEALLQQETVGPEVLEEILGPLPKRAPVLPAPRPVTQAPAIRSPQATAGPTDG